MAFLQGIEISGDRATDVVLQELAAAVAAFKRLSLQHPIEMLLKGGNIPPRFFCNPATSAVRIVDRTGLHTGETDFSTPDSGTVRIAPRGENARVTSSTRTVWLHSHKPQTFVLNNVLSRLQLVNTLQPFLRPYNLGSSLILRTAFVPPMLDSRRSHRWDGHGWHISINLNGLGANLIPNRRFLSKTTMKVPQSPPLPSP